MNELSVFEEREILGKEFKIYGTSDEPLFLAKDVAELTNYKKDNKGAYAVSSMLRTINEGEKTKERIKRFSDDSPSKARNTQDMWFLTKKGLVSVLQKTRKVSTKQKKEIIEKLNLDEYQYIYSCKESEFIYALEEVLTSFDIKGIKQFYACDKYRIDYYIPSLNVAIEYDEYTHKQYSYEQHEGRQKEIENELGCTFVRVTDEYSTFVAIGKALKEILHIKNNQLKGEK